MSIVWIGKANMRVINNACVALFETFKRNDLASA